jgi:hypothetical protein
MLVWKHHDFTADGVFSSHNHGRRPFKRREDEEGESFDEEAKVGYCPSCGAWVTGKELIHKGKKRLTKCCLVGVRWGVRVEWASIAGMTTRARGTWAKGLSARGLISSNSRSPRRSGASTAEKSCAPGTRAAGRTAGGSTG